MTKNYEYDEKTDTLIKAEYDKERDVIVITQIQKNGFPIYLELEMTKGKIK